MAEDINALPFDSLSDFDVELQDFFRTVVIEKKQKVTDKRKQLTDALRKISTGECPEGTKSCFEDTLHRVAYLFRYGPCYTSATANHLLEMFKTNPTILKNALDQKVVNICLMGGGPGTEVVALSRVLSSLEAHFDQNVGKKLRLRVTIVDKSVAWKETDCKLLETLVNSAVIIDKTKIVVRLRFLEADMTEPITEDVRKVLHEADVVTMVAFLSSLGKMFSKNISKLVQYIAENMKPGGVLFYLDVGKTQQCRTLYKSLDTSRDVELVYGPIELEAFALSLQSLEKNVILFWKAFHENICLPSTIVNSCAWIRTELRPSLKKPNAVTKNSEWKEQWKKKALQTVETLKAFQSKVKQILPSKKSSFEKESTMQNTPQTAARNSQTDENKSKHSSNQKFNHSKQSESLSKKSMSSFPGKKSKDK